MATVAITVRIEKSIFHVGTHLTCLNLYTALEKAGFSPVLLNISDNQWFAHIDSLKNAYKVVHKNSVKTPFDVLIEVEWHANTDVRKNLAKRTIVFVTYPPLFHDIECSAYPHRGLDELIREHPEEPMTWDGVEAAWIWDFCSLPDEQYLALLSMIPIYRVPYIWYPNVIEAFCKEHACTTELNWQSEQTPIIHICESNKSTNSSCIIPISIVRALRDSKNEPWCNASIMIHDSEKIKQHDFFKSNIINNMRLEESAFTFVGRKVFATLTDHNSVMLMHQRFRPIRAALFDALWLGIPVVHNYDLDMGYVYVDNSVSSATEAFNKLTEDFREKTGYFASGATELRRKILTEKYSQNHDIFKQLLASKIVLSNAVPLRIWFEDFWAGFQPDYNFFTHLLTSRGKSWILDSQSPTWVFVGPYAENHKRFPSHEMGGPIKIMFTGENTRPNPEMQFNMGFDYRPEDKTYLRLPLWMIEINWFDCDPERVVNPKPFPLERITDVFPDEIAGRHLFCGFVVSNPHNLLRNEAFHKLSTYKPVASGGALFNNIGHKLEGGPGGGGGELTKLQFFRQCKFAIVFENSENSGYVTEKLLHAKAAGCIPIYWGDPDVAKEFNPQSFVDARSLLGTDSEPNWNALIAEVRKIDTNGHLWLQMYNTPLFYTDTLDRVEKIMNTLVNIFEHDQGKVNPSRIAKLNAQMPVEVMPRVWLGCAQLAADEQTMALLGITHIVNCIANEGFRSLSHVNGKTITSFEFASNDIEGYPILDLHYSDVKHFIDNALTVPDSRVFIHCRAGINRSGALVVAYASEKTGQSAETIINQISCVRPFILLNNSFREQVIKYGTRKNKTNEVGYAQIQDLSEINFTGQLAIHRENQINAKRKVILVAATASYVQCVVLLLRGLAEIEPDAYIRVYAIDSLDVEQRRIITSSHPRSSIHNFNIGSGYFSDYLAPEHYAWKIWLIYNEIHSLREKAEGRSLILYLDSGMVPVKSDISAIWKIIDSTGCLFINDSTQINQTWCHPTFCNKLSTTNQELAGNQILAGILGIATDSEYVESVFDKAYVLSLDREIIAGARWAPYTETCKGHRHDQSILSILTHRAMAPRQNIEMFYADKSFEDARAMGVFFYVHRGRFIKCIQFSEHIGQTYVIVNKRIEEFKMHAGNLTNVYSFGAYDQSVDLSLELRNKFKGLTVEAIIELVSHQELWQQLASSDCDSYCIIDDVCNLGSDWRTRLATIPVKNVVLLEPTGHAYIITRDAATKLVSTYITKPLQHVFDEFEPIYVPIVESVEYIESDTVKPLPKTLHPNWNSIDTEDIKPVTQNDEYNKLHSQISDVWELLAACLEKQLNIHACALFEKLCETWEDSWFGRTDAIAISAQIARLLSGNSIRTTGNFMSDLSNYISGLKKRITTNSVAWLSVFNAFGFPVLPEQKIIVYSGPRESVLEWEYQWICELIPVLKTYTWIQNTNLKEIVNNTVFIVAGYMPDTWNIVREASKQGKTFMLIHTSDEWELDSTREFYTLPGCKFVVRNYWRPGLEDLNHVYQIPLGYKQGFGTSEIQQKREYIWSFVGDPNKSHRKEALALLETVKPHFVHRTAGWKASNCLSVPEYQAILEKSVFAPCMTGNWNVDCFRIWEALESGAIPVVFSPTTNQPHDYFTGLLGNGHPIIVVSNWEQCVVLMESLMLQPMQLMSYQQRLFSWWKQYKTDLKNKLATSFT